MRWNPGRACPRREGHRGRALTRLARYRGNRDAPPHAPRPHPCARRITARTRVRLPRRACRARAPARWEADPLQSPQTQQPIHPKTNHPHGHRPADSIADPRTFYAINCSVISVLTSPVRLCFVLSSAVRRMGRVRCPGLRYYGHPCWPACPLAPRDHRLLLASLPILIHDLCHDRLSGFAFCDASRHVAPGAT
jgi:hypothetical protein